MTGLWGDLIPPGADRKALPRMVKTAQKITNSSLPSLEDIYINRCRSVITTPQFFRVYIVSAMTGQFFEEDMNIINKSEIMIIEIP